MTNKLEVSSDFSMSCFEMFRIESRPVHSVLVWNGILFFRWLCPLFGSWFACILYSGSHCDVYIEDDGVDWLLVLIVLHLGHWMDVCKCRRRKDCRTLFTAAFGDGLIWTTIMSCKQLTTVNMHLDWRRSMCASIHTIMWELRHLVSALWMLLFWMYTASDRW